MNHAELHRTGWPYCAPYYKIVESAESTERRRKAQKGQKAQKGAERDFLGCSAKKNRCKSWRLNWWLIWPVRAAPAFTHLLTIFEWVKNGFMQFGGGPPSCDYRSIRYAIACKALNGPYFAFLIWFSTSIAAQRQNGF